MGRQFEPDDPIQRWLVDQPLEAKDPASVGALPGHGPTTPLKGTAMDAASNTTAPAVRAMVPPGFQKSVDDLSYALNDLRMFASILETLAETKLENEANPELWNMPKGFTGSVLHTNEADEILFLVLKVENMARKVDGMWGALLEAMPAVEERAA